MIVRVIIPVSCRWIFYGTEITFSVKIIVNVYSHLFTLILLRIDINIMTIYTNKDANIHRISILNTHEPRHEKTCFSHMRTKKVQISLRIRTV